MSRAHVHVYGNHPRATERVACSICGFSIPRAMLRHAVAAGASATPNLLAAVKAERVARVATNRAAAGLPPEKTRRQP